MADATNIGPNTVSYFGTIGDLEIQNFKSGDYIYFEPDEVRLLLDFLHHSIVNRF